MKDLIVKNKEILQYVESNGVSALKKPLGKDIFLDDVFVDLIHDSKPINANVKKNDNLVLQRNEATYNEYAIEVRTCYGILLGDVDEYKCEIFARLIDAGKELKASVKNLSQSLGNTILEISIYLVDY